MFLQLILRGMRSGFQNLDQHREDDVANEENNDLGSFPDFQVAECRVCCLLIIPSIFSFWFLQS